MSEDRGPLAEPKRGTVVTTRRAVCRHCNTPLVEAPPSYPGGRRRWRHVASWNPHEPGHPFCRDALAELALREDS